MLRYQGKVGGCEGRGYGLENCEARISVGDGKFDRVPTRPDPQPIDTATQRMRAAW